MSHEAELLPCPFCGGQPRLDGWYGVRCKTCHAEIAVMNREPNDTAIKNWNRRWQPSREEIAEALYLASHPGNSWASAKAEARHQSYCANQVRIHYRQADAILRLLEGKR